MNFSTRMSSPLGPLTLRATDEAITALNIGGTARNATIALDVGIQESNDVLDRAVSQLGEYFAGNRTSFDLPLEISGTPFQEAIWKALGDVPFGTSVSYQELGQAAGRGNAPRAVGGAVGRNPIAIIVPCHRVLASNARITGYSGGDGIVTKEKLLALEGISYR
jgi:methylated-DNA-[protein]-cysteine S-methyltransferase